MSDENKLKEQETQQAHEIIKWAEALANRYEIGLMIIINTFITSRDILGDTDSAMKSVEGKLNEAYIQL